MNKITINEFDKVYKLFEDSFIPSELRPYALMKDLFLKEEFIIYAYVINDNPISAMIVWEFDEYIFVENFATLSSFRGQGIGTKMLDALKDMYNYHNIVLEVELPYLSIEKRRVDFYKRNGFYFNEFHYIQPVLRPNFPTVLLHMMSYPNMLNENQFNIIKETLFESVYKIKSNF